ncbi:uncharacterized protein EV422DRAFT_266456 [Fimicolochytrium jonesii]|uniref:uncharacterized protein n=1 Tax=Fimicolochytrium jonesii TaxID=1396493 RepID=UPI0022FDB571|nr:uncharacterized protein EV422DRAFT_266456 [Fimicolochytrium jonesii]KAI8816943.1 hypothetical protein EV422DRAFT_266456 [Fimicolochytrium jonesii]
MRPRLIGLARLSPRRISMRSIPFTLTSITRRLVSCWDKTHRLLVNWSAPQTPCRVLAYLDNNPVPAVDHIGKFIQSRYPVLSDMPTDVLEFKANLGGEDWYIATKPLHLGPGSVSAGSRWQLVIAFPRSDFFYRIDQSIRNSIIVIAVCSTVGLLAAAAVSFVITVPLQRLAHRMTEVTNLKFSALENGKLQARSLLREIGSLENTFAVMVRAFAAGIRKNSEMTNKMRSATSGPRSSNGPYVVGNGKRSGQGSEQPK